MKRRAILAALCVAGFAAAQSFGAIHQFQANMDGLEEVPVNASLGTGILDCTLDDTNGFVQVTAGSYANLLAPSSNGHIHGPALPGVNAGVVLPLTGPYGVFSGPLSGSGTLTRAGFTTQQLINAMLAGEMYVNVHSTQFPGGEIRGQLRLVPEPATAMGLMAITGVVLARRRRHA